MIDHPKDVKFEFMVSKKLLINVPVKVKYVTNVLSFFNTDLAEAQGKTVRTKPYQVEMDTFHIPKYFISLTSFWILRWM